MKVATSEFIKPGCCAYCGEDFKTRWGRNFKYHFRNVSIEVTTESGPTILRVGMCRDHWPLSPEDKQWILDCHKIYFQAIGHDVKKQPVKNVETWELTE